VPTPPRQLKVTSSSRNSVRGLRSSPRTKHAWKGLASGMSGLSLHREGIRVLPAVAPAATTTTATAVATVAAAPTGPLGLRPRLIHVQRTSANL